MDNTTYYQRNTEIMLNKAKNYYENDKERLRDQEINIEKIDITCLKKKSKN